MGGEKPDVWKLLFAGPPGKSNAPWERQSNPYAHAYAWGCRQEFVYSSPSVVGRNIYTFFFHIPEESIVKHYIHIFTVPGMTFHTRSLSKQHETPSSGPRLSCSHLLISIKRLGWSEDYHNQSSERFKTTIHFHACMISLPAKTKLALDNHQKLDLEVFKCKIMILNLSDSARFA